MWGLILFELSKQIYSSFLCENLSLNKNKNKKMLSKDQKEIFDLFSAKTIAYNPELAKVLGSVHAALMMGQLLYWRGKGRWGDSIYKTVREMQEETGLSRSNQETAIKICQKAGVLEVRRRGYKGKRLFSIKKDRLEIKIASMRQSGYLSLRKPAYKKAETPPSITESTTESTTKDFVKNFKTDTVRHRTTEGFSSIGKILDKTSVQLIGRQ